MREVLRHRAHGRLIAGAGKAGVVDAVPDLVCDGQGRPKAVLSDADRNPGYWWLRLTTHRTFIRFSLTRLSGVFVDLGSFHLLLELRPAVLVNYLLNSYWTFRESGRA